jgi:hypothetical protein
MLFTKNGPLHNDAKNGKAIYDKLMRLIFNNFENEGESYCEISGLHFQKSFRELYIEVLKEVGCTQKEIDKKDTTINRCWFPLIGGLGSDAQALPQAKFEVNIHPICIAIMQFLPLSAFLYKGGILLIDSINFEFAKDFISSNTKEIKDRIETSPTNTHIENVNKYNKGHYLLKAIDILNEKEDFDEYSDLNLWSFSNSGTGASCSVERVPNELIKRLMILKRNPLCTNELKSFLLKSAEDFLNSLESNNDFSLLYPSKGYEGASVDFFDVYHQLIGNTNKIQMAKYISALFQKYITDDDKYEKLLSKTDAYNSDFDGYRTIVNTVLLRATKKGDWNIDYHLEILNNPDTIPLDGYISNIYKMIHFYYQNRCIDTEFPVVFSVKPTKDKIRNIISLIDDDKKRDSIIKDIKDDRKYREVNLLNLFIRKAKDVEFSWICNMLFENNQEKKYGLLDLLHIYYNQPQQNLQILKQMDAFYDTPQNILYKEFVTDYIDYYFDKYKNDETGTFPYGKFEKHVLKNFPREYGKFLYWFEEAVSNVNDFLVQNNKLKKWNDNILYDKRGERIIGFSKFAIEFFLNKEYYNKKNNNIKN